MNNPDRSDSRYLLLALIVGGIWFVGCITILSRIESSLINDVAPQETASQDETAAIEDEFPVETEDPVPVSGTEISPPTTISLPAPNYEFLIPDEIVSPVQVEFPRLETSRLEITPPPAPAYQPPPTVYVPPSPPPLPSFEQPPYSDPLSQSAYIPSIPTSLVYVGGSTGHWIESVSDDGRVIVLEDQSVWEVHPFDQVISALWLPVSDIVVVESNDPIYSYRLINKDDRETVLARLIAQ